MIIVNSSVVIAIVAYQIILLCIIWYLWGRVIKLDTWRRTHINVRGDQHGFEYKD